MNRATLWMGVGAVAVVLGCTDFGDEPFHQPPLPPSSVVITAPAPGGHLEVGQAVAFAASVLDVNGDPVAGAEVEWSSANTTIARMEVTGPTTGRAIGVGVGTTEVRAKTGSLESAQFEISVLPRTQVPASIAITSPSSPADLFVGATLQFTAAVLDTLGDPIPSPAITWQSGSPSVASIDATGLARGVSEGQSSITAWVGTLTSAAVILRVQPPGPDFTTQVQPIFTLNCSAVSCHGNQAGLTLNGAARSYAELVNVPAETPGTPFLRVAPGDPNHSFLYIKLAGCPGPECRGSRMPFNEPPLPAAQINIIRDWIAAGARR